MLECTNISIYCNVSVTELGLSPTTPKPHVFLQEGIEEIVILDYSHPSLRPDGQPSRTLEKQMQCTQEGPPDLGPGISGEQG